MDWLTQALQSTASGVTPTGDDGLKKLQVALVGLSNATKNPAINPGAQDGVLANGLPPDRTMAAVAAAMGIINQHLPTWAGVTLSIAMGVGATTATAKQAVLQYSSELRDAVLAATATAPYYTGSSAAPGSTAPSAAPVAPPAAWYTTWWGIGAIAIGALGVLSMIAQHRAARAVAP
jgi:hypothetical protein